MTAITGVTAMDPIGALIDQREAECYVPRRYSRRGHQPQWRGGAAWALLKQYYRAQHRLGALHHKKYPSGDAWLLTVLDRTAAKVTFGNRRTAVAHLVKQLRRQARAA